MIIGRIAPPTIAGWSGLLDDFDRMRREFDRVLQAAFRPEGSSVGVYPPVNLSHDTNHYFVRAEVAGFPVEKLALAVTDNTITLSGTRESASNGEANGYHRKEIPTGFFKRAINIPAEVDRDRIEAKYEDGILTVRLPKSERAKPKQIEIQTK